MIGIECIRNYGDDYLWRKISIYWFIIISKMWKMLHVAKKFNNGRPNLSPFSKGVIEFKPGQLTGNEVKRFGFSLSTSNENKRI